MFDADNSGTISAQELILVMENLNMNPSEQDISGLLKVPMSKQCVSSRGVPKYDISADIL